MQSNNQSIREINILKETIIDRDEHIKGLNRSINNYLYELDVTRRERIQLINEMLTIKETLERITKQIERRLKHDNDQRESN